MSSSHIRFTPKSRQHHEIYSVFVYSALHASASAMSPYSGLHGNDTKSANNLLETLIKEIGTLVWDERSAL